jgi:aminoglycoside 3-N-acetyltransferase
MREIVPGKSVVTIASLEAQLSQIGIQQSDNVMIHASLRKLGPVENRGNGLIQALINTVSPSGTLLAYADFEPTNEIPFFDPTRSPARPDYGVFTELLRNWPNAARSKNPGASMVAVGALAESICTAHPLNYGYGPGSPLAKLVENDGKVLLIGSDLDQVTLLHYAEHLANIPNKRIVRNQVKALQDSGEVIPVVIEEFDTSKGVVSSMPERYFERVLFSFIDTGNATTGKIGNADSYQFRANDLVEFAVRRMESDFGER